MAIHTHTHTTHNYTTHTHTAHTHRSRQLVFAPFARVMNFS